MFLLDFVDYFHFPVGETVNYNLLKIFLVPILFLIFFFQDPYNLNVGAFDMVPDVSETVPSSSHSFYFILLFRSYFHQFIFQLTYCSFASYILLNPLQYSCLENPMGRGAWWDAVHRVAKSWTRLNDFTFTFHFHALEKEMAAHSSVLAWRIPGMTEPGGLLLSMGSHIVRHD